LARELAPKGITINNVQPGPVDTDGNSADGPAAPLMLGAMALERFGDVSEVGAFVSFLAGPEGGFITGASLSIDGGFTA
jgi:3-oxoacyl-[acyl-carrier protein] reductase